MAEPAGIPSARQAGRPTIPEEPPYSTGFGVMPVRFCTGPIWQTCDARAILRNIGQHWHVCTHAMCVLQCMKLRKFAEEGIFWPDFPATFSSKG